MAFRGGTTGIELRDRMTEMALRGMMTVLVLGGGIIEMALRGRMTEIEFWAIWYYMTRWEKSGPWKSEPRPTTPAAYV